MTPLIKIRRESDSTGVPGLDDILAGGYAANRAHLIEGRPGSGKTTLGLQFLLAGSREGETCLYITLSESKREVFSQWLLATAGPLKPSRSSNSCRLN